MSTYRYEVSYDACNPDDPDTRTTFSATFDMDGPTENSELIDLCRDDADCQSDEFEHWKYIETTFKNLSCTIID